MKTALRLTVLAAAIFLFGLMTVILLIVDAATGGVIKPAGASSPSYGSWNANVVSEFDFPWGDVF